MGSPQQNARIYIYIYIYRSISPGQVVLASVATPDASATKGSDATAASDASAGGPSASTSASTPTGLASVPNPKISVVSTSHSAWSGEGTGER